MSARDPRFNKRPPLKTAGKPAPKQEVQLSPFFKKLAGRRTAIMVGVLSLVLCAFAIVDRYVLVKPVKEHIIRLDTKAYEFVTDKSRIPVDEAHWYDGYYFSGKDFTVYRTMTGAAVAYNAPDDPSGKMFEPFHHPYSYIGLFYVCGLLGVFLIAVKLKTEYGLFANAFGVVMMLGCICAVLFT